MTKDTKRKLIEVFYAYCMDCKHETIDNRVTYCQRCRGVLVAHFGHPEKLKLANSEREILNKKCRQNYIRYLKTMEAI